MNATETLPLVMSAISLAISFYLAYLRRKDDKVDIRVTIKRSFLEDPADGGTATYTIVAQNFGKRNGSIDSVRLKLQCEDKEYLFRSPKAFKDGLVGEISIPYELLPGHKLETTVDFWEIYKFVEDDFQSRAKEYSESYSGGDPSYQNLHLDLKKLPIKKCKLIAYFEDQLGVIRKSKPVNI